LPSLLPSRPFPVARWVLRVFPARASSLLKNSLEELLMTFASSSERPEMARGVVVEVALNLQHLPLVGFVRVCPSSDILRSRPLPTTLPLPSAFQCKLVDSFRPRGFAPPRRFTPRSKFRACCIPVPEGVRAVSASKPPLAALSSEENRLASGDSDRSRSRPSHPPKKSPQLQPFRIAAAVAPSSLRLRSPHEQVRASTTDPRPRGFAPLLSP